MIMKPQIKTRLPVILAYAAIWTAFHWIYYEAFNPGMAMPVILILGMFVMLNGIYIGFSQGWKRTHHILKALWLLLMIPAFLCRSLAMTLLGAVFFEMAVSVALIAVGLEIYFRSQPQPAPPSSSSSSKKKRKKK